MARRSRTRRSCGWPSTGGEGRAGGTFEPPGGGQPCEGRGPNRRRSAIVHLDELIIAGPAEPWRAVGVGDQVGRVGLSFGASGEGIVAWRLRGATDGEID